MDNIVIKSNECIHCPMEDRRKPWCRLLMVQMIFGVTYGGNCPFFRNYPLKKLCLIIYDLLVIMSFGLFEYFAFSNDVFNRLYSNATNQGVMCILFRFGAFSLAIEFLGVKIMLLKNGWNIIKAIKYIGDMRIDVWQMRLIHFLMIGMAFLYAVLLPLNFTDLDKSITNLYSQEKLKTVGFFIVGIFYAVNKFSVTSLLLFTALAIKRLLIDWTENLKAQNIKIQTLCESILTLRRRVEEINSFIGLILLTKIFVNAMFMSSAVCSLSVGYLPFNAVIGISGFSIAGIIDITLLCYSSQIMIDSMTDLCKEVENILVLNLFNENNYKQLNVILSMKTSIKLKVLGLFDLKNVTILAIIGYVTNYAIILIQTTTSSKP